MGGTDLASTLRHFIESYILTAMVLGAVVANLATHHDRPFHAIEDIEWPFLILFFLLAGATLQMETLTQVGLPGSLFIALRLAGRVLGTRLSGWLSGAEPVTRRRVPSGIMRRAD